MEVRLLKYAMKANASRNVYIGSGEKARNIPRSPLAMPYELRQLNWKDDAERDEKIAQYKVYLWDILKNPNHPKHQLIWTKLRSLKEDSILLCYCYPKNCHGHVIVKAWQWARDNGKLDIPRAEPPLQQTTTNETQLVTLETQARANLTKATTTVERHGDKGKDRTVTVTPALMPKHTAPGPLDMMQIMDKLSASLGTEIPDPTVLHEEGKIIQHTCTTDTAHLIDARLDETILEKCHCAPPQKTRATRRPRLSFDEPRSLVWNEYDDVTADLADMAPCLGPHAGMSPGLIAYIALPPEEQAKRDAAFDRAEERYEAEQLAILCHDSVAAA